MQSTGNIVERLYASFSDLEQAIESAKNTLSQKESVPAEVMNRLNSYDGVLVKQRKLASELCMHISTGNWDEVTRHVTLINGLSQMIRDDAREILASLSAPVGAEAKDEEKFC